MAKFYVNDRRQDSANNNNEVHKEGCYWMPNASNRTYLGDFIYSTSALTEAKKKYPYTADGCIHCCPEIHKF